MNAGVAELADAPGLGPGEATRGGSNPFARTIIDEAHRGMHGRDAARATTIMQKFLKGSPEDGLPAMPVVIGMTATSERFNSLAAGIMSTTHHVVTMSDHVAFCGVRGCHA